MKQIKTLLALLCIVLAVASCSEETETGLPQTTPDVAQLIRIAPFPAFDEGAQTRAIGNPDSGKTTWEEGDNVLLGIEMAGRLFGFTLTYSKADHKWTSDKPLNFNRPDYSATATLTAYYAPDYTWVEDPYTGGVELTLKSGAVKGTSEYITYTVYNVDLSKEITIDFAKSATRTYSRLRIATIPNTTIRVEFSPFFEPAGPQEYSTTIHVNADAKGNAYLYGSWAGSNNTNLIVKTTDAIPVELARKTGLALSIGGRSYAISAYPKGNYDYKGTGNLDDPWLIWDADQLQSMNTALVTDQKIFAGKYFKLIKNIDFKDFGTFTPIGNKDKRFAGTFDGGGHTIGNLTLGTVNYSNAENYSALFACTEGATISNLILEDTKWSEEAKQKAFQMGTLIGSTTGSETINNTITNCHVRLSASSGDMLESTNNRGNIYVGGLIGYGSYVSLQACSSEIGVSSQWYSGGLMGQYGHKVTLIGCRATGAVNGRYAGGLIGNSAVTNRLYLIGCYASGDVSGALTSGGFVGYNILATVLSCYFGGSVSGGGNVGSFLGDQLTVGSTSVDLYYSAATSNMGTKGVGWGSEKVNNFTGVKLGCAADAIYGIMVDSGAETEWLKADYNNIRTAVGNKHLSELWVSVPGAAPKLWWEE